MHARPDPLDDITDAVRDALRPHPRVVLAVSGGRDSMVMLDAALRAAPDRVIAVATFDHGTGAAASEAAALVERTGARAEVRVVRGGADGRLRGEAAWRSARWSFLHRVALAEDARIATAHTLDDQVETVFMRALRGSGARGLAGLAAPGDVLRPLLGVSRAAVGAYARARSLEWVEDPSNRSRRFLRNRVRLDLLPALERADAQLPAALLDLARRAAALRREVEAHIDRTLPVRVQGRALQVARADLARYDARGLRLLCPALAARVDVTLDRRGTHRLTEFIIEGKNGSQIQLSGGYEAILHRDMLQVRPRPRTRGTGTGTAAGGARSLQGVLETGGWRFRLVERRSNGVSAERAALWMAVLPADQPLTVRPWRPGDRMVPLGAAGPRRVKGLLRDADVDGPSRTGWPVVLAGDQIVWIPGVRRSIAATARPGRPELVYLCERIDCC